MDDMTTHESTPRFCSTCGKSLVSLDVPHVARNCEQCGKTIYIQELRVREGDRFVIPKGFIRISLDPTTGTVLTKPGLAWLISKQIMDAAPRHTADIMTLLDHYENQADEILGTSSLLKDLDLSKETDSEKAFERLKEKGPGTTREWWALQKGAFVQVARDALSEGTAEKVAWAFYHAAMAHVMTVIRNTVFQETLWRGYRANRVIYEAIAAASTIPAEQEAIRGLEPLFSYLDDATLHAWVEANVEIGSRIGVSKVSEEVLHGLARWEIKKRQLRSEESKANRELKVKWAAVGVAAGSLIATLLEWTTGVLGKLLQLFLGAH